MFCSLLLGHSPRIFIDVPSYATSRHIWDLERALGKEGLDHEEAASRDCTRVAARILNSAPARQRSGYETCTAARLLPLPEAEFGAGFGPPFAPATKAGRSTRSPIM